MKSRTPFAARASGAKKTVTFGRKVAVNKIAPAKPEKSRDRLTYLSEMESDSGDIDKDTSSYKNLLGNVKRVFEKCAKDE